MSVWPSRFLKQIRLGEQVHIKQPFFNNNQRCRPYEPLEALKGLGIGVEPTVESKSEAREPSHKLRRWEGVKKERRVRENEIETEEPPKRRVQAPDYYSSRRKQRR